jgi:O-antigen/teichoic acid export membrane protein
VNSIETSERNITTLTDVECAGESLPVSGPNWLSVLVFWLRKVSFSVLDQGLISGSNFLIGVLLARWLEPEQFGAYALAFSAFLLISVVYQALVLEPQSVFATSTYRHEPRQYMGSLLRLHGVLASALFLAFATAAVLTHGRHPGGSLPGALAGIVLATPWILLLWLSRRMCYAKQTPHVATSGAVIYSVIMLCGLLALLRLRLLTPATVFTLMGVASLVTSLVLLVVLRPSLLAGSSATRLSEVSRQHWSYGRWALAAYVMAWVPGNLYYLLLGRLSGMADVGALRALLNLALPVGQTYAALSMLFLPFLSRVRSENGSCAMKGPAIKITVLFAGIAVAYWTILITFSQPIVRWLYAGRYVSQSHWMPFVAIASVFWCAAYGPMVILRVLQTPVTIFWIYTMCAAISVLIGAPITKFYGLAGAMVGGVLSSLAALLIGVVLVRRRLTLEKAPTVP